MGYGPTFDQIGGRPGAQTRFKQRSDDMTDRMHQYVMGLDRYLVDNYLDSRQPTQLAQSMPPQSSSRTPGGTGYSGAGPSSRAFSSQPDRGSSQIRPPGPQCSYFGRYHLGECYRAIGACFSCSRQGHVVRYCPYKGNLYGTTWSIGSVIGSLSSLISMHPMGQSASISVGRGRGHGEISSSSGPSNRTYVLATRQDQEAYLDVITDTLLIFS
ncbi:uncharacterized protein LOC129869756 [Solanum dulcamara]|uniref:uncharacterized protein LOC129869756 n=1 Tax=Solanum dulcamara TaxID=45834 RepID=UPI002485150C|nr:uncharacterized protein LOC129869756 [Solanum dulcamara]